MYSRLLGGHRDEYNVLFEEELRGLGRAPVFADRPSMRLLNSNVFFLVIDDELVFFIICALASFFTGKRVGGLFFRPAQCFHFDSFRHRIKYLAFSLIRRISGVCVLTVLPFSVDPRLAKIARNWIYDPQLWDIGTNGAFSDVATTGLAQDVIREANGRKIVMTLGGQQRDKGSDFFSEVWCNSEAVRRRYLFVAAGKVSPASEGSANRLRAEGAVVIDRFVSDHELKSLYAIADIIWAAYAPNRDQASGIAGRAFQLGIPVLVRRGSYLAKLMHELHQSVIEVEWNEAEDVAVKLSAPGAVPARTALPKAALTGMHRHFVRTLREAVQEK